jgi:hypothetical protein
MATPAATPRVTRQISFFTPILPSPGPQLFDTLALVVVQDTLAQPDVLGGDLDQLVLVDELKRGFQREGQGWREKELLVGGGGADVGQLLGLGRVDYDVVAARVQAHHLAAVDRHARRQQQGSAFLQVEEGVGVGLAGVLRDQHTTGPALERSCVGAVVGKVMVEDAGAARVGEKLRAITDEPTRGNDVFQTHAAFARRPHVLHAAPAPAQLFDHRTVVGLVEIDDQFLIGLQLFPVGPLLEDHLWLGNHQLVAFAAHGFDQHRQVQLAAAQHLEGVGRVCLQHAQGHVGFHFFEESLADIARGDELALLAGEGSIVRQKLHLHRGLFDLEQGKHDRAGDLGDGLAHGQIMHAGDGADVARHGFLKLEALERLVAQDLGHAELFTAPVAMHTQGALALVDAA